jgi:DNA primase
MNDWIDFKELRSQLDFAEVLRHYGVEVKADGDQHHGFCPLPSHKGKRNSPSFSANLKKGIWQCFGCGGKGNILDFAVLMEAGNPEIGADLRRVAATLREKLGGSSTPVKKAAIDADGATENAIVNASLDFELKALDAVHPYLPGRGFTPETIARFGLGYCSKGLLAGRIAIPLHDDEGRLIGYAGRLVDNGRISEENPKYKFPGRRVRKGNIYEFRKSHVVYNIHRIPKPVDRLIVVEGFTTVWRLGEIGFVSAVAVMGSSCSEEQAVLIAQLVNPGGHVWIFTDGDEAGIRCAASILSKVSPYHLCRWVKVKEGEATDEFPAEQLSRFFQGFNPTGTVTDG